MPTSRQVRAEKALANSGLMDTLVAFSPTVVSTIWVELDTDASDIDIICTYIDEEEFVVEANKLLKRFSNSSLDRNKDRVLATFNFEHFPFEIYGSKIAITDQNAYRHFKVMQRLVALNRAGLSEKIRNYKESGMKTEPAIAETLKLEGDPYEAVLELEQLSDQELLELAQSSMGSPATDK